MRQTLRIMTLAVVLTGLFISSVAVSGEDLTPLEGKKIAIFLDNYYQIDEAYYTPLRLEEAGAEVEIVSHDGPQVFRDWHFMKTDMNPHEASEVEWDGVCVIGGFSPLKIRECPTCIDIIKDVDSRGGMCSAICHGVCAFVTADIIDGVTLTGNVPRSIEFVNAGATFIEEAPQIDGNIITAIGPGDNGPYLDAMINWFDGGEEAAWENLENQYLEGKRIAFVVDNRYKYEDVMYPMIRLRHNGAEVVIIANSEGDYKEYRGGGSVRATMGAQDAMHETFDAVFLPSHWAADTYRRHADVRQFVSSKLEDGVLIASQNWGHTVLIQAKSAEGYEFATTWGMQNDIENAGGTAVLEPVHQDRNLITCASDDGLPLLIRSMVENLTSE